jgi:hypothetical protein
MWSRSRSPLSPRTCSLVYGWRPSAESRSILSGSIRATINVPVCSRGNESSEAANRKCIRCQEVNQAPVRPEPLDSSTISAPRRFKRGRNRQHSRREDRPAGPRGPPDHQTAGHTSPKDQDAHWEERKDSWPWDARLTRGLRRGYTPDKSKNTSNFNMNRRSITPRSTPGPTPASPPRPTDGDRVPSS